jgi:hypothetical protein
VVDDSLVRQALEVVLESLNSLVMPGCSFSQGDHLRYRKKSDFSNKLLLFAAPGIIQSITVAPGRGKELPLH